MHAGSARVERRRASIHEASLGGVDTPRNTSAPWWAPRPKQRSATLGHFAPYANSTPDSKSDGGFAGCGFDSRALRLKFRFSKCLNTSGLRNEKPRFPRGFSRFLAMPTPAAQMTF
jgi:hypothetical protein